MGAGRAYGAWRNDVPVAFAHLVLDPISSDLMPAVFSLILM